jgi:hypothetical protein
MPSRDRKASFGLASALLLLVPAIVRCGGGSDTTNDSPGGGATANAGGQPGNDAGAGDTPNQTDGGTAAGGETGGGSCAKGFADCDDNPKTGDKGCEADLSKPETCGACDNACAFDKASASCKAGKCAVLNCDTGYGDCDSLSSNGCETKLDDTANCGECGKKCTGSQTCQGGLCSTVKCDAGSANCDNNAANGCEPLNTLDDCGTCSTPCALTNSTATCDSGTCDIMECDEGYGNCDKKVATGCEAPLNTEGNCGACGKPCAIDNAEVSCDTGECKFIACLDGYADCNQNLELDGCEVAIDTLANCGACGATCSYTNAKTLCEKNVQSGKFECNFTSCDAGWENVTPTLADGCECQDSPSPAPKTCATAKNMGSLNPGSGTFEVVGSIPVPTDSDWFAINLGPSRPVGDIQIKFGPTSSSDFKFDVATACNVLPVTCKNEGTTATGVKTWQFNDVCTGTCQPAQSTFNTNQLPSALYIRVYRDGAALSCNSYTLQFSR